MAGFDITSERRHLEGLAPRLLLVCGLAAVVGLGGAVALSLGAEGGVDRLLETYLVSFAFLLTLSLGALFFVMLQHLTRAGWSVTVRRLAEGAAANVDLMAVLVLPVLLALPHLYHWAHPGAADHDPLLAAKAGYLEPTFFTLRVAGYFVVWIVLAQIVLRSSVAQDASGDPALTRRLEKLSAPGMILFALSLNFAAFDLLMSLDPHWFSTIFGVYLFGGAVVGSLAVLILLLVGLQGSGRLTHAVTPEHFHDLGKLLFAFVVFWAYIAFSQYMLIWYANIPEETQWFLKRQTGDWTWISLALLAGHFVLPFLALLSRVPKRRPRLLAAAAVWLLAMHWLDMYWLVMPEFSAAEAPFGAVDLLCLVGLTGLWLGALVLRMRRRALVPERDPRLDEAVGFENG